MLFFLKPFTTSWVNTYIEEKSDTSAMNFFQTWQIDPNITRLEANPVPEVGGKFFIREFGFLIWYKRWDNGIVKLSTR